MGLGEVEDKAMMGGRGKEINCGTKKQIAYLKKMLIQGLYKIKEVCQTNKLDLHQVRQKTRFQARFPSNVTFN